MTRAALACAAVLSLCACSLLGTRPAVAPEPAQAAVRLAAEISSVAAGRAVAFRGIREADGSSSIEGRALGELLESELLRAGVGLVPLPWEDRDALQWQAHALLPETWRADGEALSLGGQVRLDGRLAHLRLVMADPHAGTALWWGRASVRAPSLERLAGSLEQRTAQAVEDTGGATAGDPELAMDLHVIVRRDEGGFTRAVEVEEGGALRQGDRLQIRFRTDGDFEVYAFLLRSDGEREDIFGPELVYGGRLQYGPSQEGFEALSETDQVHTLYVLAAARLDGFDELFEDISDLVKRSQVDGFAGLDKVDDAIVSFLERRLEGTAAVAAQRGGAVIERGDAERWVYGDGQVLETRSEVLTAPRALVRALSFEVAFP